MIGENNLGAGSVYGPPAPIEAEPKESLLILPIEEFVEFLGEEILASEMAWRTVDTIKRNGLSSLVDVTDLAECNFLNLPTEGNREHRRAEANNKKEIREFFANAITYAQYAATLLKHGETKTLFDVESEIARISEISKIEVYDDYGPQDENAAKLTLDLVSAFINAQEADQEIIEKLSFWIEAGPDRIIHLMGWLHSDQAKNLEFRPLLELVASHHLDPNVQSIFDEYFNLTLKNPKIYQATFLKEYIERSAIDENRIDPDLSWLHYLFELNMDNFELTDLFARLSLEDLDKLPLGLSDKIKHAHEELISESRRQFGQFLSKHDRPSHHLTFGKDIPEWRSGKQSIQKSKKRGLNKNTELTSVRNEAKRIVIKEDDLRAPEPITKVFRGAKSNEGFVALTMQENGSTAIEALMSSRIVAGYLDEYRSVPDLANDIQNMLVGVLNEPRGNGATKMAYKPVRMMLDDGDRKLSIWHLNPVERRSMPTRSNVSRHTRIYYCTWPSDDGTEALVLMSINHKKSVAIHNGNFRASGQ